MSNWLSTAYCIQYKHHEDITCDRDGPGSLPSTGSSTRTVPDEWGLLGKYLRNGGDYIMSLWPLAKIWYGGNCLTLEVQKDWRSSCYRTPG